MTYRVHRVQAFTGKQVIVWLEQEQGGATTDASGSAFCVRLDVTEAPRVIADLVDAYAVCMQEALIEVAAGGCRTCRNERKVDGKPCPTCTPRAESRIRNVLRLPPRRDHR